MKTLIIVIIIGLISLLAGCSNPPCTSPNGHEWAAWEDVWKEPNEWGGMRQTRKCKKCGLATFEIHQ